ncbi:MAG TPA: SDR family oxidoreductase [Gemmataceae bacterium]|jgi:NAD(P)-dependent dehydrogenase (short-subunit alcohol dehydrogenase family)|nr:SDR family oxidoreductase [Gemmataceae bacterium]
MKSTNGIRTFAGAAAIITGGASGIGQALGEALARRGAQVVLADLQGDRAREVAAGIEKQGGKARAVEMNVVDFAAINRLVEDAVRDFGRLDYIFNNAGIGVAGEVRYYQIDDWNRVLDVNLRGVINGIQAAYPVMLRQGFGHIVNTSSMAGLVASPWTVSYCAAKFGVVGLSLPLRVEAAAAGVRVSVICPGVIRTPILDSLGGKSVQPISVEKQRAVIERLRPMDPNRFAEKVLRAVARNRAIIIVPAWWRLFWWMYRLSPWLTERYMTWSVNYARRTLLEEPAKTP